MAQYRKRPIIVEAVQWFPGKKIQGVHERACGAYGHLRAWDGGRIVMAGDWIITGPAGKKSVCRPAVFEATYELVVEED